MEYSYDGGMGVGSAVEWMVGRACSIGSCVSNASGEGCERRDKKSGFGDGRRRWETIAKECVRLHETGRGKG